MKSATGKELIVGVVFFAIVGVLAALTVFVSGVNPFTPPHELFVYFDKTVGGIRKGNVVGIEGMEVGKVDEMELLTKGVLMRISLIPGVTIHPGYSVKVRSVTSLGGKYVDVDRGDTNAAPLELPLTDWPTFSSPEELASITGPEGPVLAASTEIELFEELSDLVEQIKPAIEEATRHIGEITEKMNSGEGTLGKFVGDPALADHLTETTSNVNRATEDIAEISRKVNEGDGTFSRLVNDPKLAEVGAELSASAGSLARKVEEGRGPLGRLSSDEALASDLADAADHLGTILDKAAEGNGTVAALLNEPELSEELAETLANLSVVAEKLPDARGPIGILFTDEQAQEDLRRTIAHLERVSGAVTEERGSLGRMITDERLLAEAELVLIQFREGASDVQDQNPINGFTSAVFQQIRGDSGSSGGLGSSD